MRAAGQALDVRGEQNRLLAQGEEKSLWGQIPFTRWGGKACGTCLRTHGESQPSGSPVGAPRPPGPPRSRQGRAGAGNPGRGTADAKAWRCIWELWPSVGSVGKEGLGQGFRAEVQISAPLVFAGWPCQIVSTP